MSMACLMSGGKGAHTRRVSFVVGWTQHSSAACSKGRWESPQNPLLRLLWWASAMRWALQNTLRDPGFRAVEEAKKAEVVEASPYRGSPIIGVFSI